MVNNCAACTEPFKDGQRIKCSKCASLFHSSCVNISDVKKIPEVVKSKWLCPLCQSRTPKGDNSNTPVRAAASLSSDCPNVTLRDVSRRTAPLSSFSTPLSTDTHSLSALTAEIKLLRLDVGEVKTEMKFLAEHIARCNSRLDEYEKNMLQNEERISVLEQRTSVIISLENTIAQLREQQNSRAQSYLKNEIEIVGINENPNENPHHIIQIIAQKIGAPIDDKDLEYVTRVGPFQRSEKGHNSADQTQTLKNGYPRPLVVRFLRRNQRDEFLKSGKFYRNLNCTDIEVTGPKRNIYVNERLTQENRQLFRMARQSAKESGLKYCWIKNGAIYIRKQDGNPAVPIKNAADLRHLLDRSSSRGPI